MLPAVTSFDAREVMKGAGSVFSILAIAPSASALRLAAPGGTMSSSSTGTPALANCAAMPAPMTPAPMTVALWMCCTENPLLWFEADKLLDPFEDRGNTLTAADTLGGERIAAAHALQKTRRLAHDARSGGAARMPEGNRTAVDVQGLVANSEIAGAGERLTGKGLVQFDHVDGRDLELGAEQRLLRGANGADAHDIRRAAGDRNADDAGERSEPVLLGVILAAHQHGRRAVGERRRGAGGDGAGLREGGFQLSKSGRGRLRTNAAINVDGAVLGDDGHDLVREMSGFGRGGSALLAAHRKGFLLLAADVPSGRHVLGGIAHADVRRLLRLEHGVRQGIEAQHGDASHAFDAGCDEDVARIELYLAGGDVDRLHRGAAKPVDRHPGHRLRQPGQESDQTADVETLFAFGKRTADDEVLDILGSDVGAVDERGDHLRGEVIGAHAGQGALVGLRER